ncbi:glyoxalase superfamily protein [Rhizobium oryziradicis]|uniref:Glyoxalase-related protein domain-containing protein n=1 Tax=Rhizobium oryziradicis TaxID=1867956 RepID=A0A1Q8ZP58_9HYPH|nr:glyoxalase superfamily protein [Rhizobium oryziradicis]OLP43566.1 hypothetical protein BJF95_22180 [Rhizobium oryziradicis]
MNTFMEAKHMAKVLEGILRERNVAISHGETLNIVARQFGLNDWNTLSARIKRAEVADGRRVQALVSWDFVGEHPTEYDFGLDEDARNSGRRAAMINYSGARPTRYRDAKQAFGSLCQTVSAVPYQGQRLEVTATLATEKVSHGATIWARVDKSPGNTLAFDNLKDRPDDGWMFGDNNWGVRRLVIDVPPDATSVQFGFFLKGTGTVWSTDFSVAAVGADVPVTGKPYQSQRKPGWIAPSNLDFSQVVDLVP